jgi:hypothetical protein
MSDKQLWVGYLEAGAKSSPVLIDDRLDTGNPKTQFIFNLVRGEILEYSREIVEPKLRRLRDEESDLAGALEFAFSKARPAFNGRIGRGFDGPAREASRRQEASEAEESEEQREGDTDEVEWDEAEEA